MEILQEIPVNNQRTHVIARDKNGNYHIWDLKPNGERDEDPFWNKTITPPIYELLMQDYKDGLPEDFCRGYDMRKFYKKPFEEGNLDTVMALSNWFAYAYIRWDKQSQSWVYGRNRSYERDMKSKNRKEKILWQRNRIQGSI